MMPISSAASGESPRSISRRAVSSPRRSNARAEISPLLHLARRSSNNAASCCPALFQAREAPQQEFAQIVLPDYRHIHHHEPGNQRFVQLPGPGVAIVHGADEPGRVVQRHAAVARNVNDPAEIQRGVEHGQRFVFRHIHLVQNAEAAKSCALAHGAFPEADLASLQRIGADEGRRVHIDVHGDVPHGAAEQGGQILRQHVFAGGLGACQK